MNLQYILPQTRNIKQKYSGPSLSGHSQQRSPPIKATVLSRYYCKCIDFSLSPKATPLMWPQFLGK